MPSLEVLLLIYLTVGVSVRKNHGPTITVVVAFGFAFFGCASMTLPPIISPPPFLILSYRKHYGGLVFLGKVAGGVNLH